MRAIVNTGPGKLEFQDWPLPKPGPGQVRIRTAACGICATDLEMIDGWDRTGYPSIPGHEWSGRVDAVGQGVDEGLLGKRCVGENVLDDGLEVGFEHPGAYAECFLTQASKLQILPDTYRLDTAALIEPLAVCVHGLSRLKPDEHGRVLIFGDGPIGLILAMLLEHMGEDDIVLVGGRDSRLALAHDLEGVHTVNYHRIANDLATGIRARTGNGFKHVVEASGSPIALDAGISLASSGADILVIGDYGEATAHFPWNLMLHSELRIVGSNASAGSWPEAVRIAVEGELPLERLVTHRYPVRRYREAIEIARDNHSDCIKAILAWDEELL